MQAPMTLPLWSASSLYKYQNTEKNLASILWLLPRTVSTTLKLAYCSVVFLSFIFLLSLSSYELSINNKQDCLFVLCLEHLA